MLIGSHTTSVPPHTAWQQGGPLLLSLSPPIFFKGGRSRLARWPAQKLRKLESFFGEGKWGDREVEETQQKGRADGQ